MSPKVARVPQLAHQLSEASDEREHSEALAAWRVVDVTVVVGLQEIVTQWRNIGQCLESELKI